MDWKIFSENQLSELNSDWFIEDGDYNFFYVWLLDFTGIEKGAFIVYYEGNRAWAYFDDHKYDIFQG